MVQALIAFLFFLTVSALILTVFWGVQIRYGNVSGLDPNSLIVRTFAKKNSGITSQFKYGPMFPTITKANFELRKQVGMAPAGAILTLNEGLHLNVQITSRSNSASQSRPVTGTQSASNESLAEPYAFARD
jgi:hypothetical protein